MSSRVLMFAVSLALSPLAGCVTSARQARPEPVASSEKALIKKKVGKKVDEGAPVAKKIIPVPSQAEQLAFFKKHSKTDVEFVAEDHQFLSQIPADPQELSVSEAVVVLGLIKTVLNPLSNGNVNIIEEDLLSETSDVAAPQPGLTLEKLAEERNVDVADALAENPLLSGNLIAEQVLQALNYGENSSEFKEEIKQVVKSRVSSWQNVAASLGMSLEVADAADITIEEVGKDPNEADKVAEEMPGTADLRDGDTIVMEAQAAADQGKFQDAIRQLRRIPSASPMFNVGQEKIREFSDIAVRNLRRKAAQAFQSAMPISDTDVRLKYLQEAKEFLEEALRDFPSATQLPTVRDNLRVISRDLENLEKKIEGE